jgi:NDP-sugar pyrophosphorylase family protein
VADRPKALAEVNGRPFLAYLLDQLANAGCRSVIVCTGYLGEQIYRVFGESYGSLIRLGYSREEQPAGTAGALRLALPHLKSNPILVMNGDSFCAADIGAFIKWFHDGRIRAGMLLAQVTNAQRYGAVKLADDGSVVEFREKGHTDGPCWINAGVYLLSRDLVAAIPENVNVSLEYDIFPQLVGHGLYGYLGRGRFLDIGTPEDFALAEIFFAR